MNKVKTNSKIEVNVVLTLTEEEARALKNITVYGNKPFLEWFYKNLGKHYLKPHEDGLVSLFDTINKELTPILHKIDQTRKILKDNNI